MNITHLTFCVLSYTEISSPLIYINKRRAVIIQYVHTRANWLGSLRKFPRCPSLSDLQIYSKTLLHCIGYSLLLIVTFRSLTGTTCSAQMLNF